MAHRFKTCAASVLVISAFCFSSPASAQTEAVTATPASVTAHYATLVHANYDDTLKHARGMQAAINAFTAAPAAETLAYARKAWLAAREFYGQTEAFRF